MSLVRLVVLVSSLVRLVGLVNERQTKPTTIWEDSGLVSLVGLVRLLNVSLVRIV